MRSPKEISFRLKQEIANAVLLFVPARGNLRAKAPLDGLPSPQSVGDAVRQTPYATELIELADKILSGRVPIFGSEINYGPTAAWQCDPLRGTEAPRKYFRFVPYLDPAACGDHKWIWEINRHQHLVVLARAFVLTGKAVYFDEVVRQLEHWWADNPFQRGINWTSALEVGFRALSWIWIWHLLGDRLPNDLRRRFLGELYRHGLHLQYNLSIYFSPNTHLLGEAVALHALGRLFPEFPRAAHWRKLGRDIVREQMRAQVRKDGSHFEQSTYYHVYALDLFLLHAALEETTDDYRDGLSRMADFLASVVNANGDLPFLGDDDGGRVFYPFGARVRFARATLATASLMLDEAIFPHAERDVDEIATWWLGPEKCGRGKFMGAPPLPPSVGDGVRRDRPSRVFADSGLVVMQRGDISALFDAGPFGPWSAGHSHADTLSLVVFRGREELLVDPGTYTYMDAEWRDAFRGTAAHNTVRIDGKDQAVPAGPFRWIEKPEVRLLDFTTTPELDRAIAVCRYRGFTHQRTVRFNGNEFDILDELEGPPGEHSIEQFWHVGATVHQTAPTVWQIGQRAELVLENGQGEQASRSRGFGAKEESQVVTVRRRVTLPASLRAQLRLID
jgi:Heparinase II/III-like protein/Heparinase II/III N-terminus